MLRFVRAGRAGVFHAPYPDKWVTPSDFHVYRPDATITILTEIAAMSKTPMKKQKNVILALGWHDQRLLNGIGTYATKHNWHISEASNRNPRGKFFNAVYQIPPALVAGKPSVTVRFQCKGGARTGGLFGLRVMMDEFARDPLLDEENH